MPILFWFFQPAWITSAKLLLGDSFKVNALNINLPRSCHQSSQLDTSTDSASLLRKSLNWCWAAWYSSGVVAVRMGKTSATNFSFNSPNSFAFRLTESLKWNSHPNFVLLDVMSFFCFTFWFDIFLMLVTFWQFSSPLAIFFCYVNQIVWRYFEFLLVLCWGLLKQFLNQISRSCRSLLSITKVNSIMKYMWYSYHLQMQCTFLRHNCTNHLE